MCNEYRIEDYFSSLDLAHPRILFNGPAINANHTDQTDQTWRKELFCLFGRYFCGVRHVRDHLSHLSAVFRTAWISSLQQIRPNSNQSHTTGLLASVQTVKMPLNTCSWMQAVFIGQQWSGADPLGPSWMQLHLVLFGWHARHIRLSPANRWPGREI